MTVTRDLKVLGKLGEETGELSQVIGRCTIQGIYEKNPDNGKINKRWLEEEIADVQANMSLTIERFALDKGFIAERAKLKIEKLRLWHEMPVVPPYRSLTEVPK